MREAPIGVFDSGVGGLSVLAEMQRLLPNESLLYVADCGNIPYGEKSPAFIRQRCAVMADFLQAQGAKAMVVACNTATVAGVADLRRDYPSWPIVGMEPAVKPAAAAKRQVRRLARPLRHRRAGCHPAVPGPGGVDRSR